MEIQTPSHQRHRLHPLIAAAAVAVLLLCLVGVAAVTGLLPNSRSENSPSNVAALDAAAAAADRKAAEAKAAAEQAEREQQAAHAAAAQAADEQRGNAVADAAPACANCGRVESVRAIETAARPSGVGVVGGAIVGGLLGNQIGGGAGRSLATVAGAVGGGYAGNEIEKRTRRTTSYQVRVRMDDGAIRVFHYGSVPPWREGDHVRIVGGHIQAA